MQRKIFRIEQFERRVPAPPAVPRRERPPAVETAAPSGDLATLRASLADTLRNLTSLISEGKESRMARAAGELGAAVEAMEKATDKILLSAEAIDDCAKALAAAQLTGYARGMTQDIQDHVTRLFEACNFQDLAGQRIGKVIATLTMVEEQLTVMIESCNKVTGTAQPDKTTESHPSGDLLNGPRLDGAAGHASQQDIDLIFA